MSRYTHFLWILIIVLSVTLPTGAVAFDILAMPTAIDTEMDAWHRAPASSEPVIYPTKRVYPDQTFRILVLGKDYSTDSQKKVDISYTVEAFDPSGKTILTQSTPLELFRGTAASETFLLLSRQYLTLSFSNNDPAGEYRFEIKAHDAIAKKQSSATVKIALAPFTELTPFESHDQFLVWRDNYYRDPDPLRAVSALIQFVDPEQVMKQKQTPLLTFLTRVWKENPFLWPHLKKIYTESASADRKKILLLFALSGQADDSFLSSLDPDLSELYRAAHMLKLNEPSDRPTTTIEIDRLWAEFVATGTIGPIRKLVGALHLESTKGTQNRIASGSIEVTPEIRAAAALESTYQAALGTLISNGEYHSLVKQYLGYIYESDTLGPGIKTQVGEILAILQQRSNENEARKHLEERENAEKK